MMKTLLIGLVFAATAGAMQAQSSHLEYNKAPEFCTSKYNYLLDAVQYSAQATLNFSLDKGGKSWNGEDKLARFVTIVDPDSVYDATFKVYAAELEGVSVTYTTYFEADELAIVLKNKRYVASGIDGGCDVHLKHLKHVYLKSLRGEQLSLKVTKDLPLVANDGKMIVLRANSSFVFDVDEVATKQRGANYYERAEGHIAPCSSSKQREQALFLYGFYQAYMAGRMYDTSNEICFGLLKKVAPKYFRLYCDEEIDYDFFTEAQDCVEEFAQSLYIAPLRDDWFEVRLQWPTICYDNKAPLVAKPVRIRIHLEPFEGSYLIDQVERQTKS